MGLLSNAEKILEKQYLERLSNQMQHVFEELFMRQHIEIMTPKTHFTGLNVRFILMLFWGVSAMIY